MTYTGKMAKQIMVVKADKLFDNIKRETKFYKADEANFEKKILENYEYMVRGQAEEDTNYKQPIPYAIVVNNEDKVFVYKRGGANSEVGEKRLYDKISIGIGGHIDKEDEEVENPIYYALKREVEEELNVKDDQIESIKVLGYLNDDSNDVGKVHLGIVYEIKLKDDKLHLQEEEIANGEFVEKSKLKEFLNNPKYDVENWSKILIKELF